MIRSMTGYASASAGQGDWQWQWDMRAVNGRGLDMRFRVPDWLDGLEQALRTALKDRVARGNLSVGLKLSRSEQGDLGAYDHTAANAMMQAIKRIEIEALETHQLTLAQSRATDILLACRKTGFEALSEDEAKGLTTTLLADFAKLVDHFNASRQDEGARLATVLTGQVEQIENLVAQASAAAAEREAAFQERFRANLARIMENTDGLDEARIAQDIAQLSVKADITEELDRLASHIDAARTLLAETAPVGRKLDFLTQEFNREANTLCSKAQFSDLTRIGLDLKAVIDQMREQVQNVE